MSRMNSGFLLAAILLTFSLPAAAAEPASLIPVDELPAVAVKPDTAPAVEQKDPAAYFNDAKSAPAASPNKPAAPSEINGSKAADAASTKVTVPSALPAVTAVAVKVLPAASVAAKEVTVKPDPVIAPAADTAKSLQTMTANSDADAVSKQPVSSLNNRSLPAAKPSPGATSVVSQPATVAAKEQRSPAAGLKPAEPAAVSQITPTTSPTSAGAPADTERLSRADKAKPGRDTAVSDSNNDARSNAEAQRVAKAMLENFKSECAPLAGAKKDSGMFGIFSSDDSPIIIKCLEDLGAFVNSFWSSAESAEALNLMAALNRARKDTANEIIVLTRMLYFFNDSPWSSAASGRLLGLALDELKSERQTLKTLAKGSILPDIADRYFQFIKDTARLETGLFPKLLRQQCDDFLLRFPGHAGAETVLFLREDSFFREKHFDLAAAGYRRVIAVYPQSPQRPGRLLTLGKIYDDQLKLYEQAVTTFEQLYTAYPDHAESLLAYQRAAKIYDEKLERYNQAVALLDRIIAKYPQEEPARLALEYQANIYTLKTRNYYSAIKAYQRIADMFKGDAALNALLKAAELARTPVEDYELQVELQTRIVTDFPASPASIQALYDSAETYAEKLKNPHQAATAYQQLIAKYPASKLVEKARANLAKLSSVK